MTEESSVPHHPQGDKLGLVYPGPSLLGAPSVPGKLGRLVTLTVPIAKLICAHPHLSGKLPGPWGDSLT